VEPEIRIHEIKPISIDGGYVIDGFPSTGFSSAIAAESIINTSEFELVGYLDSDLFPPLSIIKNGVPHHPTNIFVNSNLKIGIFSSYLSLDPNLYRQAAKTMMYWAKKHNCSLVISSVAQESLIETEQEEVMCAVSTETAKEKLISAGIPIITQGTIPGIPGILLTEGRFSNQDVVVLIFNLVKEKEPDFKSGAKICRAISKIIPGTSCDMKLFEKEGEIVEQEIKKTESEAKHLRSMYR
jgi:uncharacterized protein